MNAVLQASADAEPQACHILRLVNAGQFVRNADFTANAVLHRRPIGWGPTADDDAAFVFPSLRLAVRFAHHLLYSTGTLWSPVATPGRIASIKPDHACRKCGCTQDFACPYGWAEVDLCTECVKGDPPSIWSIFRRPTDYPLHYVARQFIGEIPIDRVLTSATLEGLRAQRPHGTVTFAPNDEDEPGIVETWA